MANLLPLLQQYGVLIVFGVVLMEQIGLPIPAYPILIVAGALAAVGSLSWPLVLAVSLLACLISDYFWFRAGQYFGKRILRVLCKISLNPDYCVSQTEDSFGKHGAKSLVVAKFIPGFNTIAPPLSGAMGVSTPSFFGYTLAGGLLWSGTGIGIGAYFHSSIDQVLEVLESMGTTALMVLGGLLAIFIAIKFWERRRFRLGMQIERIHMDELRALIDAGKQPIMVDARSMTAQGMEEALPGARIFHAQPPEEFIANLDKDAHIVVYCSCPNDASAAIVARELVARGFYRARPLHGGMDAWRAHYTEHAAA